MQQLWFTGSEIMRFPTEEEDRMFEAIKPYLDERCKLKEDAPDEIKELAEKFWESFKDAACQHYF